MILTIAAESRLGADSGAPQGQSTPSTIRASRLALPPPQQGVDRGGNGPGRYRYLEMVDVNEQSQTYLSRTVVGIAWNTLATTW